MDPGVTAVPDAMVTAKSPDEYARPITHLARLPRA
jgi:hypothetical protein